MKVEVIKKWNEASNIFWFYLYKDGSLLKIHDTAQEGIDHAEQVIETHINGFPAPETLFSKEITIDPKP